MYGMRQTTINVDQDSAVPDKILTEHFPNRSRQRCRHTRLLGFIPTKLSYLPTRINNQPVNQQFLGRDNV